MATSAYQLWLKKREFKAPRQPPSPTTKSTASSSFLPSKKLPQAASKPSQDTRDLSQANSAKFHAVSAVETTRVAVKYVVRPSATKKRPRSWLSSREEAAIDEERLNDVKVAGRADVAGRHYTKVAGWKRLRSGKEELVKVTALKLASASNALRQSSARREKERAVWSGRVDEGDSVEKCKADAATQIKSSSVQLKQMRKWKMETGASGDGTTKRLRFDAETKVGGVVGLDGVRDAGQLKRSFQQQDVWKRMRTLVESANGDSTTKRLRVDVDDAKERDRAVELSALPPKSPMKKKKLNTQTAMLDESQYWMAVDRFSHLT